MSRYPTPGRPKLPKGSAKETKLQVRLLVSEEERIEAAAQKAHKTKSQWVRDILLDAAGIEVKETREQDRMEVVEPEFLD